MSKGKKKNLLTGITTSNNNQFSSSSSRSGSSQSSYGQQFTTSNVSNATAKALKKAEKKYKSAYADYLDTALSDLQNQKPFEYDVNKDALYKQYAEQYKNLGQQAMEDTTAQMAGLSGGYANSYAATAGQQAYQQYLSELNNKLPELYAQARQNYENNKNELYNQAQLYGNLDAEAYNRYAQNREYYANKYNNEWNRNAVQHSIQNTNQNSWENQTSRQTSNQTNNSYTAADYLAYQQSKAAASAKATGSGKGSKTNTTNSKPLNMTEKDTHYYQDAKNYMFSNGFSKDEVAGLLTWKKFRQQMEKLNPGYKYTKNDYSKYAQEYIQSVYYNRK